VSFLYTLFCSHCNKKIGKFEVGNENKPRNKKRRIKIIYHRKNCTRNYTPVAQMEEATRLY